MERNFDALTEREKAALRLLMRGHDTKSAARILDVSTNSINERLREARRKLGVSSSREAARILLDAEGDEAQKAWDEKIGLAGTPGAVAKRADPDRRRRVARISLAACLGVGAMLLTALFFLNLPGDRPPTQAAASPPVAAAATPAQTYSVSLDIRSADRSIAHPAMSARAGQIASVSSSGVYDIQIVVNPDPEHPGTVLISLNVVVPQEDSQFRFNRTVSVREGQAATVPLETPGLGQSPISAVVIRARPVPASS